MDTEHKNLPVIVGNTEHSGQLSKEIIMDRYMDYVLEHNERPKNVHTLAKELQISEQEFYRYYSGFDQIEADFFVLIFERSRDLVAQADHHHTLPAEQQMLNLYYIFFENLTMHRSFVLSVLKGYHPRSLKILTPLRTVYLDFVNELNFTEPAILDKIPFDFFGFKERSRGEALWMHFLSILEFWRTDSSPSFEKTDLYIEKTVSTGHALLSGETAKKVVDLGKFLYQEKIDRRR